MCLIGLSATSIAAAETDTPHHRDRPGRVRTLIRSCEVFGSKLGKTESRLSVAEALRMYTEALIEPQS